jgi:hypothetical protein
VLSGIKASVVMLNVIVLCVVTLSVVAPLKSIKSDTSNFLQIWGAKLSPLPPFYFTRDASMDASHSLSKI